MKVGDVVLHDYIFVLMVVCAYAISDSEQVSVIHHRDLLEESGNDNLDIQAPRTVHKTYSTEHLTNHSTPPRKPHAPSEYTHGNKKETRTQTQWQHCVDGSKPKQVRTSSSLKGIMCQKEYPSESCCTKLDLTFDLLGSKIADRVSNRRCVHLLKKLRCAHCSPRSWWLFHSPDQHRLPHQRFLPILCPRFCRKFHAACRDSIAGFQNSDFCEFHTNKQEGPCFPDYRIRHGTID